MVYKPDAKLEIRQAFIYAVLFFVLAIVFFALGHMTRLFFQWESSLLQASETLPIVGNTNTLDFINFLLRRIDGLSDFYVIVDRYNEKVHDYYNLKNTIASIINSFSPGIIFNVLPSTIYFLHVFGDSSLDSIRIWYNSREISIFGISYIYGYKTLFFIGPIIFGIIIKYLFSYFNHPSRYVFLVYIFGTFGYIIRALGLDDMIFRILRGLIFTFIIHIILKKNNWKKINLNIFKKK